MTAGTKAEKVAAPRLDDSFQKLLSEFSAAASQGAIQSDLIRLFCRAAREFFRVSGVYCWEVREGELVGIDAEGHGADHFLGRRLPLNGSALSCEAALGRETIYFNDVDSSQYPLASEFQTRSVLAVPLIFSGEVSGVAVFAHTSDPDFFNQDLATKATIVAAQLGSAIELARLARLMKEEHRRAENLMNLALDLSSWLSPPDLARSFTERAADMLGARAAALALAQRSSLEVAIVHDPGSTVAAPLLRRLNIALADLAMQNSGPIFWGAANDLLGQSLASALGWQDLTVARLLGADGDLIGVVCLVDRASDLSPADHNLLQALAGHASVALENSRLFARITQANRHWAEIFDAITDFIVVHDEASRVLRINRSLADFIGVKPAELIGVDMRALVSMAGDTGTQPCPFCRVGVDAYDEYIHPVLERTYLISTSRIHGALNEAMQVIHVLKDISDRREAERRYRELFDNIQEGLFFSSPDGRFIEVNDALVRMLGYDNREELLQVDIPTQLYLSPQHRERFSAAIEQAGVLRNFEEALRRKDGSIIHTLQNAFAVRDSQGRVVQYRGATLDITELKNFQSELQRERDFNSKILNNTQSMILVADTAGLISYGNRRWFEAGGYTQEELLGRRLMDLVATAKRAVMREALEAVLAGQQVDNLELPIARGDGRIGQFSVNLSPMRDEQRNVTSIVVVMTDVTDAVMLQAKLMHTEKMAAVGQLVSGVAHEVNNPLTAILGFSDLLLEQEDVPDSAKKDLRVVIQEAQRTKQIVQNLLSFARQMPPQRKPVQVNSILHRTLQLRAYDFANHGVDVVEQFQDPLPEIVGDSHQLQQVFLNIINNAYDAVRETGRPGRIEIETGWKGEVVEITFRDNGHGIAYPDRIFDPFFTTKEVGKGTGLGLSICYGIIREHGGEISCHNNPGREGATFFVRLPVTDARWRVQPQEARDEVPQ